MNGVFLFNKAKGISSFKALQEIKHKLKLSKNIKIGHAGTLDPISTGLLLVCIGSATKLSDYLMSSNKKYLAKAKLGSRTDTYDAEGAVVSNSSITPSDVEVLKVLSLYKGNILQFPPIYSAIKYNGKPLYKYARNNETVLLKERPINILELNFINYTYPYLEFDITCSKGTYIRSIIDDIGFKLKCFAYLEELQRLNIGSFSIDDSYKLEDLNENIKLFSVDEIILKLFPHYLIDKNLAFKIANGYKLEISDLKTIVSLNNEIPKEFALFVKIENALFLNSIVSITVNNFQDFILKETSEKIIDKIKVFNYNLWM